MRVTIVTPSLNQGNFIEQTIKSVISQKGDFEIEYIIIDGGSKDNSLEIIKKYDSLIKSKKFKPRCKKLTFKWVSEKDNGQSEAINKGFKMATGDVVNWLCADDLLCDGSIQKVIDFFSHNSTANVVFGLSKSIDEKGDPYKTLNARSFTRDELIRRWDKVYCEFNLPQSSTFVRTRILRKVGLLNERLHLTMDYEWYLRLNKYFTFYFIDEVLSNDRTHDNSKSNKFREDQYNESIRVSRRYWNENYLRYLLLFYSNLLLKYFYRISCALKKSSIFYSEIVDKSKKLVR